MLFDLVFSVVNMAILLYLYKERNDYDMALVHILAEIFVLMVVIYNGYRA
jgi:hypothetical protein